MLEELGDHFRVRFTERGGNRPQIQEFPYEAAELDWVAQEVIRLISDEEVRPEDILIVFYRSFDFEGLERRVKAQLPDLQFIHPFGENRQDKERYIFQPGYLTVSTVYGAKGYDAPIIFVVGADRFENTREGRAAFYVAVTRAKLLLYVTGVNQTQSLLAEAKEI